MTIDLSASRIAWRLVSRSQIEAIIDEAGCYGDSILVRRAKRALARRVRA